NVTQQPDYCLEPGSGLSASAEGRVALGTHAARDDVAGMPLILRGEGGFLCLERAVALPIRASGREDILVDGLVMPDRCISVGAALVEIVPHDVFARAGPDPLRRARAGRQQHRESEPQQ